MTLSIINPSELKEIGLNVDSQFVFEKEELFNPNDIAWIFYGQPYEHILLENGVREWKYGLNHSFGYIESFTNPEIKYDVVFGLLISRINSDLDNCISDTDSETESDVENYSNSNIKIKKNKIHNKLPHKKNNFKECEIYVDEFNYMDFESNYNKDKIKYKFIGNPTNKFNKYGFDYADGILLPIDNTNIKLKLINGIMTMIE